jgi:hypothetical protein
MASMLQYGRELPDQANSLLHHLSSVVSSYSDLEKVRRGRRLACCGTRR